MKKIILFVFIFSVLSVNTLSANPLGKEEQTKNASKPDTSVVFKEINQLNRMHEEAEVIYYSLQHSTFNKSVQMDVKNSGKKKTCCGKKQEKKK